MRGRLVLLRAAAVLVFLAAVAVRLPALGERSFWIDELITRDVARLPLWLPGSFETPKSQPHSIVSFTVHDLGPGPLTYVLEGWPLARWAEPWGREWLLRVPGLLAGLGTVLLALTRGRRWTGGRTGALVLGTAAAVWPLWADFSTGARGYAWGVLIALLQLGLLVELSARTGASGGSRSPLPSGHSPRPGVRRRWFLFSGLALAGFFLHPVHLLQSGAMAAGALAARLSSVPSLWQRIPRLSFYGIPAAVLALQGGWLLLWMERVRDGTQPAPDGQGAADLLAYSWSRASETIARDPGIPILIAATAVLLAAASALRGRARRFRPAFAACGLVLLGSGVLVLLLAARFMITPRYFYALSVVTVWLLAGTLQALGALLRRNRFFRRVARPAPAWLCLGALTFLAPGALRTAAIPVHDWAGAVAWLKPHIRPDDLVLLGPNADYEVYRAYADPAGIPAPALTRAFDPSGREHDLTTEAGLEFALQSQRRIWFLTPFWGRVFPPGYWRLLGSRFRQKTWIPGRAGIRILLHEPTVPISQKGG